MRFARLYLSLLGFSLCAPLLHAQAPVIVTGGAPGPGGVTRSANRPQGLNSPVPAILVNARKVFISNGGADAGLFPHPFTGTQDRGYGLFYKALAENKRFDLMAAPSDAELVFEVRLSAPTGSLGGDKTRGTEDALPTFTLTIFDRPTHYILWRLSQTIDKANLQKTHDKNFDDALNLLLTQLMTVVSGTAPAPATAPAP